MKLRGGFVSRRGKFGVRSPGRAAAWLILSAISTLDVQAQGDPNAMAQAAREAMAAGRFGEAAEIYADLASRFPNEPALQANLGMALHFSGRDADAIAPLNAAALDMPSSLPAHFALGASLSRLGRHSEAIDPLRKAARIDPQHAFAKILLGESLEAVGEHSQAVPVWRSLESVDASNPFAHAGLVRCNEELAAAAIDQLREREPESPYMLRILGRSRLQARQYPSALYLFRTALERQPGVRAVHEAIAQVYEGSGQTEWAASERRKAESLPVPDCADSRSAECNFANGRFDLAPTLEPDLPVPELFWAARSRARLAERAFEKLASLPESAEKLALLSDILASQGQFSKAADACRRTLELGGGSADLERQLAELLYLAGRVDEARPLLERFHRSDREDPRWAAMLGNLLAGEQEYEQAVPLLEHSLALPGAPATARLDLGRSYLALNRPDEALPHLESSLELDEDGSIHYQLAQALQRLGMRDRAREALMTYQELDARRRQQTEAGAGLAITAPE